MLSGSLAVALKSNRCGAASSLGSARAGSQFASQTSRISGLYRSGALQSTRSYAGKSSGDLFSSTLGEGDAMKEAGAKVANFLKPRIPVQRTGLKLKNMRKHYKHKDFLESVAHKRRVPTSMKKVWHEARAIRRLPVAKALSFLEVYPTRSAKHLKSAVKQAKLNAVWRGFKAEDLEVSKVVIGKGMYLKRMMPHAKGRAGRVTHPFHHLSVYVRPSKKALKENEAEIAARTSGIISGESTASVPVSASGEPVSPVSPNAGKGKGWWPFGKKEGASL